MAISKNIHDLTLSEIAEHLDDIRYTRSTYRLTLEYDRSYNYPNWLVNSLKQRQDNNEKLYNFCAFCQRNVVITSRKTELNCLTCPWVILENRRCYDPPHYKEATIVKCINRLSRWEKILIHKRTELTKGANS